MSSASSRVEAGPGVVPDASGEYDIVLVAVRAVISWRRHAPGSRRWPGKPAVVLFGNNPAGRSAITSAPCQARCTWGSPASAASWPTGPPSMSASGSSRRPCRTRLIPGWPTLESALASRGFTVRRVADMDGWLAYHAAFVACIAAALYRCGTDPVRLAADRRTLELMCHAITEAFAALRADGTAGLPRNLAVLHSPLLRPVAVRYWARAMRSPMGELCFAAHCRHAEAEMRALGDDMAARITDSPAVSELLRSRASGR